MSRIPTDAAASHTLLLCPFLDGLDPATALWLGPLPWNDCNGCLLRAIGAGPVATAATVFAGAFCAEPFRAADEVLDPLRRAGVAGVVNLPSVSFLDGQVAGTLEALNLGVEREVQFLEQARSRGFRIGCCVRTEAAAPILARLRPELVIRHAGPLLPLAGGGSGDGSAIDLTVSDLLKG